MVNVHGQEEGESKSELSSVTSSSGVWEDLVSEERKRIEELLKSKGMPRPALLCLCQGPKGSILVKQ